MKKTLILILLLFTFLFLQTSSFAAQKEDVRIILNSKDKQFTNSFKADVNINFINISLYNSQIFLSYHVYDEKDNELLWEGKRVPVKINEENIAQTTIDIDLSTIPKISNVEYAKIKLDLVDEKNLLWFSTEPQINLLADEIIFQDSYSEKFKTTINYAVKDRPLIFFTNLVFFLVFIMWFIWVRRNNRFL